MSPIDRWLTAFKSRQPARNDAVLDPQDFQSILNVERARSDRSGWPFTLAVIQHQGRRVDRRSLDTLLEVIQERTRLIDVKGWYNGNLAIILPYTHAENAHEVLKAIEQRYVKRLQVEAEAIGPSAELEYTVYCYPPSLDRKVETV